MRRLSIFLAIGLASMLMACTPDASTPTPGASSPVVEETSSVIDEQALWAAETLFNIPAKAYVVADTAGKLDPATKAKVKPIMASAYEYLKTARTAYAIGDKIGFDRAVASLRNLTGQANAALPATEPGA